MVVTFQVVSFDVMSIIVVSLSVMSIIVMFVSVVTVVMMTVRVMSIVMVTFQMMLWVLKMMSASVTSVPILVMLVVVGNWVLISMVLNVLVLGQVWLKQGKDLNVAVTVIIMMMILERSLVLMDHLVEGMSAMIASLVVQHAMLIGPQQFLVARK